MGTIQALEAAIRARVPALLWGPPGIGKTAQIEQLAARLRAGFVGLSLGTLAPEDLAGLPVPSEHGVVHQPLAWVRRAIALGEEQGLCIVLMDEFSCARPAVQAALLTLVQSRRIGDTVIPRSVAFVAAANPADVAADGWELPLPTVSRWLHLQWPAPTVDEWADWLLSGSVRDDDTEAWRGDAGRRARSLAVGYLQRRTSRLAPPLDKSRADGQPQPCPRSWELCCRALAEVIPGAGPLDDVLVLADTLVAGCVGRGDATEFLTWVRETDLPDPEDVLRAPEGWHCDATRQDKVWATLGAISQQVRDAHLTEKGKISRERWDAAWRVYSHAERAGAKAAAFASLARPLSAETNREIVAGGVKRPGRAVGLPLSQAVVEGVRAAKGILDAATVA